MNCGMPHGKHSWRDFSLSKFKIEEFDRGWCGIAIILKVETFSNEFASLFSNKQETKHNFLKASLNIKMRSTGKSKKMGTCLTLQALWEKFTKREMGTNYSTVKINKIDSCSFQFQSKFICLQTILKVFGSKHISQLRPQWLEEELRCTTFHFRVWNCSSVGAKKVYQ